MQPEQCLQVLINAARVAPLNYYQHAECDRAIQELDKFIKANANAGDTGTDTPDVPQSANVVTNNGK